MSERLFLVWVDPGTGKRVSRSVRHGLRIGSSSSLAEVVIAGPGVNPLHAEFQERAGAMEVAAIGTSVVIVDGFPVARASVQMGSRITVGPVDLSLDVSPPPVTEAAVRAPMHSRSQSATSGPGPRSIVAPVAVTAVLSSLASGLAVFALMARRPTPLQPPLPGPDVASVAATASSNERVAPAPPAAAPSAPEDPLREVKGALVTVLGKLSFEPGFSTGSGIFVTSSGRVVTNYHVVYHTDYQQVLPAAYKRPVEARVIAKDIEHDLALLQAYVEGSVSKAPFGSSLSLRMGDAVFALGSPSGPMLASTLTRGVIGSDAPRQLENARLLQHDAAINPGNSGGPLVDQSGKVVGLNTLKIRDAEGLSFAVPIEDVREFVERAR